MQNLLRITVPDLHLLCCLKVCHLHGWYTGFGFLRGVIHVSKSSTAPGDDDILIESFDADCFGLYHQRNIDKDQHKDKIFYWSFEKDHTGAGGNFFWDFVGLQPSST